jgi:hypothetical protein
MNAAREILRDSADDAALVAMIDTWTKRQIIEAYSFNLCTEAPAIQLIYEHGLRYA